MEDDRAQRPQDSAAPPLEWLQRESGRWVTDGLITPAQRAVLGARYGLASDPSTVTTAPTPLPLPAIVLSAAFGLLALGLLLIVAANWGVLSYWQRLVIVAVPGLVAALAAPWIDRPGWRHPSIRRTSQFVDAIVAASLLGAAAVISQHLQQSLHDWFGFLLAAAVPCLIYLELRRSTFLATAAWVAAAGLGVRWLGEELELRAWLPDGDALTNWFLWAMGLVLAIRARGYWAPLFALVAGYLLAMGLIIGSADYPGPVWEATLVAAMAAVVAIGICALRVWHAPHRTWPISLTAVIAVGVALLWFNVWNRLIQLPETGPATSAYLASPSSVALGPDGSLYIADAGNRRIRKVSSDGTITTVAGTGRRGPIGDDRPAAADVPLASPAGVAGTGPRGAVGDDGPATAAPLASPAGVAVAPDSSLYIADQGDQRIRKISPAGIITTVAGTDERGLSGDGGPATTAQLASPDKVAVAPDGSLYIADQGNQRIRKVSPEGVITTVAGTSGQGDRGDGGPATAAQLGFPTGIAVGPDGSLYIADENNHRLRKVGPDGVITTVAGTGEWGDSGDGGPATTAQLASPSDVAVGPDGNLFIVDRGNHRLYTVSPDGIITTVAGTGEAGTADDPLTRLFLVEGTWWIAATATALLMVVWLRTVQQRRDEPLVAWHTLRWLLLVYAIVGAFVGVGQWLDDAPAQGISADPAADAGVLGIALLVVGLGWRLLNRAPLLRPPDSAAGDSRQPLLLTAGAPLAAGTALWVLWMPVMRLIAEVEPAAIAGTMVPLAQWGLTVLGAVWVMVLLAQQAGEEQGQGGRITWALVTILSLALLVVAYVRQDSLLQRGLTFVSVSVALLVGLAATRWRRSSLTPSLGTPRSPSSGEGAGG